MALAVVGIKVEIKNVTQAIRQVNALRGAIDQLVASTKKVKGVKFPTNIVSAAPGAIVGIDQSKVTKQFGDITKLTINAGRAAATASSKWVLFGKAVSGAVGIAAAAIGKLPSLLGIVGRQIGAIGTAINQFGRRLTTFGSVISTFGFRLTAFVSLPIAAAIGGSTRAASEFEDSLVSLETKVGLSQNTINNLKDELFALAPALGQRPVELATAAYEPFSRGIRDSATSLQVLELAGKANAIGLGETADIAKILTAAFITYGAEAQRAGTTNQFLTQTADQLVAAIQRGSLEAEEFVEPLGRTLGLAANLGVAFDEVTSFMGTFGAAGVSASEAVTGLNRVMASFLNPTKSVTDALEKIGLSIDQVRESVRTEGLIPTLLFLRREFDRTGVDFSEFIGRLTGLNAALFVTGGAADLLVDTLREVRGSAGALGDAFAIVEQTTSFQIKQLRADLEVLAITVGDVLLPKVRDLVGAIRPLVQATAAFAAQRPQLVEIAVAFGAIVAAVGPLTIAIGLFLSSLGTIATAIGVVVSALGFMLTPIGAITTAIVVLAGTITGLYLLSLKDMAEKSDQTFEGIARAALEWGRNIMVQLARGIAAGITYVVNQLIAVGRIIRSWLGPGSPPRILPDLPEWGANIINELLRGMTQADWGIFKTISSIVERAIRSLGDTIGGEEGVGIIPHILGSRDEILGMIETWREFGHLPATDWGSWSTVFGSLGADLDEFIITLFRLADAEEAVAAAQEAVNKINEDFEASVKPLNDELKQIDKRFDAVRRQQEEQALRDILADPRAPALAKELAQLQLRRLELQGQVAVEEEARDVALELANARLEAATAERDRLQEVARLQEEAINFQIENNDLMRQQAELLERIAEAQKKAASGADGPLRGGGPIDLGFDDGGEAAGRAVDFVKGRVKGLEEAIKSADKEWTLLEEVFMGFGSQIESIFAPLFGEKGLFAQLSDVWSDIFLKLQNFKEEGWKNLGRRIVSEVINGIKEKFEEEKTEIATNINTAISTGIDRLKDKWPVIGSGIAIGIESGLADINALAINTLTNTFIDINTWFKTRDWEKLGTDAAGWITDGLEGIIEFWTTFLPDWWNEIVLWFEKVDWYNIGYSVADNILTGLKALDNFVLITLPEFREAVFGWFFAPEREWRNLGVHIINGIITGVEDMQDALVNAMLSIAQGIIDAWIGRWRSDSPSKVAAELSRDVMRGFVLGMTNMAPELKAAIGDMSTSAQRAIIPASLVAAGSSNVNSTVNMGPVNVNNGMDQALFEARVRQIVAQAVR